MFDLSGSLWAQGGAIGLVALVVILILMGRLVPRRTLEDAHRAMEALRQDKDAQVALWRQAAEHSEAALDDLRAQAGQQLELARTSVQLLQALTASPGREVTASAPVVEVQHAPQV